MVDTKIGLDEKKEIFLKILESTSAVVSGYVSNNDVPQKSLPELINSVYDTFENIADKTIRLQTTNVSIEKTVHPDYIVCLEDGRQLKMLKRYLARKYHMTPEQYRKKWNLPDDYPFVAPNYARKRSKLAKRSGLGKR